jgi:hypothetical protein
MKSIGLAVVAIAFTASVAHAQDSTVPDPLDPAKAAPTAPAAAVEYSHAYEVRATIHKYASVASLPLFVGEAILGQSLYSSPSDGKKSAHIALGTAIGGLFGVNTVTGVWNLVESRKDPYNRRMRLLHSLLMLGADAGFVATAAITPEGEGGRSSSFTANRSMHRTIALTSLGVATTGYLIMLFD